MKPNHNHFLKGSKMAENKSEGTPEVDRDVRVDEAWKANLKRTYDEMQQESLETMRQCRVQMANIQALVTQSMQNAIETANLCAKQTLTNNDLITKQCIRHNDVAIDCTWDPGPGEESLKSDKK
jgi:hypothetical protein